MDLGKKHLILTERDLEVLKFLLLMKFADSSQIMRFCFRRRKDNEERTTDKYIKHRLQRLMIEGYVNFFRRPNGFDYIYQISKKGYATMKSFRAQEGSWVSYPSKLRISEFHHDWQVIEARIQLERSGRAKEWVSERLIKSQYNIFDNMPARYIPDGLFVNVLGELTAFELEIARKSKIRYQEKIEKYVSLIRSHFKETIRFRRVLFFTMNNEVFKILSEMTRIHPDIFRVEKFLNSIHDGSQNP